MIITQCHCKPPRSFDLRVVRSLGAREEVSRHVGTAVGVGVVQRQVIHIVEDEAIPTGKVERLLEAHVQQRGSVELKIVVLSRGHIDTTWLERVL